MFLKKKRFEINELQKELSTVKRKVEILEEKLKEIDIQFEQLSSAQVNNAIELHMRSIFLQKLNYRKKEILLEIKELENRIDDLKRKLLVSSGEKKLMERYIEKRKKLLLKEEKKREMGLLDELSNHRFTSDI